MDDEQRCRAELADAALVHAVGNEVAAAAAELQRDPLNTGSAERMRRALADRVVSARAALGRLQAQYPPPGVECSGPVLRVVTGHPDKPEVGGAG